MMLEDSLKQKNIPMVFMIEFNREILFDSDVVLKVKVRTWIDCRFSRKKLLGKLYILTNGTHKN